MRLRNFIVHLSCIVVQAVSVFSLNGPISLIILFLVSHFNFFVYSVL